MTLYEILGIEPTATLEEIKEVHKKLIRKAHPDRNPAPDAAEQFRQIHFAYSILSDDAKRAAYDRNLKNGHTQHYENGKEESFSNIFVRAAYNMMKQSLAEFKKGEKNIEDMKALISSFESMTEEQKHAACRENIHLIKNMTIYNRSHQLQWAVQYFTVDDLIAALKLPHSAFCKLASSFNAEKFCFLFERLTPEQRWDVLQDANNNDTFRAMIFSFQNKKKYCWKECQNVISEMVLSPQLYFDELNQQIDVHTASTGEARQYRLLLAYALCSLRDNLEKTVRKQQKNKTPLEVIQDSREMHALRDTIAMLRAIETLSTKEALNAISRYQEKYLRKPFSFKNLFWMIGKKNIFQEIIQYSSIGVINEDKSCIKQALKAFLRKEFSNRMSSLNRELLIQYNEQYIRELELSKEGIEAFKVFNISEEQTNQLIDKVIKKYPNIDSALITTYLSEALSIKKGTGSLANELHFFKHGGLVDYQTILLPPQDNIIEIEIVEEKEDKNKSLDEIALYKLTRAKEYADSQQKQYHSPFARLFKNYSKATNKLAAATEWTNYLNGSKEIKINQSKITCLKEGRLGRCVNQNALNIYEINLYISTRKAERDISGKQYFGWGSFQRFFNQHNNANTKIAAAEKWIAELDGKPHEAFSDAELESLANGRLGRLVR